MPKRDLWTITHQNNGRKVMTHNGNLIRSFYFLNPSNVLPLTNPMQPSNCLCCPTFLPNVSPYFTLVTHLQSWSFLILNLYNHLPRRVWLKSTQLNNPTPPSFNGEHTTPSPLNECFGITQLTNKKSVCSISNLLSTWIVKVKCEIKYIGSINKLLLIRLMETHTLSL